MHEYPIRVRLASQLMVATLVLSALSTGCVSDRVTGEKRFSVVRWSVDEELELGRATAPAIEAQFSAALTDVEAYDYLNGLVLEMIEESVRKDDFEYSFLILNSSIPNAFALPGGFVYVTRGLLTEIENEAQFISIMGHELGHVEHQHSMLSQSRTALARLPSTAFDTLTLGIFEGTAPGRAVKFVTGVTELAPSLYALKFDREQEIEADRRGAYFADTMGYDPNAAIANFELFQRLEAAAGDAANPRALFRTHPTNEARIAELREWIDEEYPEEVDSYRRGDGRFEAIVERLRTRAPAYVLHDQALELLDSAPEVDDELLAEVRAGLNAACELVPSEPLFHTALGELAMLEQEGDDSLARPHGAAQAHFETAMELYEGFPAGGRHWKPYFYLGALAVETGSASMAIERLEAANRILPEHPYTLFLLGVAYEASGETAAARSKYEAVLELAPPRSELHGDARERLRVLDE